MLETIRTVAFVLVAAPLAALGALCVVAAAASRIEDKSVDERFSATSGESSDSLEYLHDLPKAA
jgi:hypothetical protein